MIALIAAVFTASLLGSLHCAGMCGAFVAFAVGLDGSARPRWDLQAAYNLGRLTVYAMLGAIAGSLGGAFDAAGRLVGVQQAAVVLAGLLMMIFGAMALLRLQGVRIPRAAAPAGMQRVLTFALRRAVEQPPMLRATLIGLTTTLMPCGWLYAFVIAAAGTARPLHGAITMAVFWAGTLPILVAVGTGVQTLASRLGRLGRHVPTLVCAAVIVIGLINVLAPHRLQPALVPAVGPITDDLVSHVRSLDSRAMPCCHDDPSLHRPASPGR